MKNTETTEKKKMVKTMQGQIVSATTPKTVIVAVQSQSRHPLYKKMVRRTNKFAAHNESMELVVGDKVVIAQTKPMSRTKHYIVIEKITV